MASSLKDIFLKEGTRETAGGNKPFLLNDPGGVWYVLSGGIDIFSVQVEERSVVGARYYFFSVSENGILYGMSSDTYGLGRGFLAVGAPGTELLKMPLTRLRKLACEGSFAGEISALTDKWVDGLSFGISKDISPRTDVLLKTGSETELKNNKSLRSAKGIIWLELEKYGSLFIGMEPIAPEKDILFPVSSDSWIQAVQDTKAASSLSEKVVDKDIFWDGLDYFYEMIFLCEIFNTRLVAVDEFNRLKDKAGKKEKSKHEAFTKIASVVNEDLLKGIEPGQADPLFIACSLVGQYADINIKEPKLPKGEERELELYDIEKSSRIRIRKVTLKNKWWKQDNGAMLTFLPEKGTPLALIPVKPGKYKCINPAEKTEIIVSEDIANTLQDEAYVFYRPFPDEKITAWNLLKFGIRGCRKDLITIMLMGVAGGILGLLIPIFTGLIFDSIIPESNRNQLLVLAMAIFSASFTIAIFQLIRSIATLRVETKIDQIVQAAVWDRLLNLPIPFFREYTAGELTGRAQSIMILRQLLSTTVIYSVLASVFTVFNFFILFYYDFTLAVAATFLVAFVLIMMFYLAKKIVVYQRVIIKLENSIFGLVVQLLSSIAKIRIAGAEIHAFSLWADQFASKKKAAVKVRYYTNIFATISSAFPLIASIFIFGVMTYSSFSMSTGSFLAFFTAFTIFVMALLQMGLAVIGYYAALPVFESAKPILDALPESDTTKTEIHKLSGDIEINHVTFRYGKENPVVLKDICMSIRPGEFVAIAGASGSGKSTLLKLLLGFEFPTSGSIYYDKQDISSLDVTSVRRQAGTVLQDAKLIPGSIFSNITGAQNVTMDEAWEAARLVGLYDDIKEMPMGMFTVIGEGLSTLSGGQRQRIIIARAIVSRPRILFFDEATSALDNETQKVVSESLEHLQSTRVVIAHRLSTIKNADRIYILDKGALVQQGSYDKLVNQKGLFLDLVKRQMVEW